MTSAQETLNDLPVMLFKSQKDWAVWLDKNQAKSSGVWLRLAKKTADLKSVTYAEALEVTLCYGWIDGQKNSWDESSWLQKFSPRGPRNIWSKINRAKAEELIKSGQMKPAWLLDLPPGQLPSELLAFGYPEAQGQVSARKSLDEVVFYNISDRNL